MRRLYEIEIMVALRLGAFGQWWASRAARRLGKLSAKSGVAK